MLIFMISSFTLGIKREHFNHWGFEKWGILERYECPHRRRWYFRLFFPGDRSAFTLTRPALNCGFINNTSTFNNSLENKENINMIQYISIHFNTFSLSDLKAIFVIAFPSLEGSARPDLDGLNQREARQNVCLSGSSPWTTSPERRVSSRAWRVSWRIYWSYN